MNGGILLWSGHPMTFRKNTMWFPPGGRHIDLPGSWTNSLGRYHDKTLSICKDLLMRTISLHVYFHIYEELFLDYCILTHVHFHMHIFSICQYEYRPPPAAPVLINEVPAKLAILFWHEAPKFAAKLHNEPRPSVHLNYIGSPNEWTWYWPDND